MDPTLAARYARQILLDEIGVAGQGRIAGARAAVAGAGESSLRHAVAMRYALRAGFAGVDAGTIDLDELAPRAIVSRPAPREWLAGARATLRALVEVVRDG